MKVRIGDRLWSPFFQQYITVLEIRGDEDWDFDLNGHIVKARTPLSYFEERPEYIERKGKPSDTN